MNVQELKKMTVKQLKKMCKEKGIKSYSKLNKEELIKKCSKSLKSKSLKKSNKTLSDIIPEKGIVDIIYQMKKEMEQIETIDVKVLDNLLELLKKEITFFDTYDLHPQDYLDFDLRRYNAKKAKAQIVNRFKYTSTSDFLVELRKLIKKYIDHPKRHILYFQLVGKAENIIGKYSPVDFVFSREVILKNLKYKKDHVAVRILDSFITNLSNGLSFNKAGIAAIDKELKRQNREKRRRNK